jgi:DnaJ-class molecular chaperone
MFRIHVGSESYYSLLGVHPDASASEIRDACSKLLDELDRKRESADADEREGLGARVRKINHVSGILLGAESRKKYDREHEHLKFFLLRSAAAPAFTERGDRLVAAYRIVADFLGARGVRVAPFSDFERKDFFEDRTPNALLDRLLGDA